MTKGELITLLEADNLPDNARVVVGIDGEEVTEITFINGLIWIGEGQPNK
ncbi:hypothetical protein GCM10028807_58170 [Spirosoma daeguense]